MKIDIPETMRGNIEIESAYREAFERGYSAKKYDDLVMPATYTFVGEKLDRKTNAVILGLLKGWEAKDPRMKKYIHTGREPQERSPLEADVLMQRMMRNPGFIPNWAWGVDDE